MAETWDSIDTARLLMAVWSYLPDADQGSLQQQTKDDLQRFVTRLQRTASGRGCPSCGSTFYTFEEASEP